MQNHLHARFILYKFCSDIKSTKDYILKRKKNAILKKDGILKLILFIVIFNTGETHLK